MQVHLLLRPGARPEGAARGDGLQPVAAGVQPGSAAGRGAAAAAEVDRVRQGTPGTGERAEEAFFRHKKKKKNVQRRRWSAVGWMDAFRHHEQRL